MFKKSFSKCCLILFLLLFIISNNISYADTVPVTDQNLKEAFQTFVNSESNEDGYTISVENNTVYMSVDGQTYNMTYDISQKPTFFMEIPIEKGMSYEEFEKKANSLVLPMLGYVAVANVQGVDVLDASTYFLFSYMSNALSGGVSTENMYTIVDDLNVSEGVTLEKSDDPKTIYTSEFGDRVIEYVNTMYKEKQSISDADTINSYEYTVEKIPVSDTSCKLTAKVVVNTDANFEQIKGYKESVGNSFGNSGITKEDADYVVTLKVGQKCKIKSNEEITGTEFYSNACVEIDRETSMITAEKVGSTSGYLYIGMDGEKKSIYITVEENDGNIYVQDLTLDLDDDSTDEEETLGDSNEDEEEQNSNDESNNNSTNKDLPKTGLDNSILIFLLAIIAFGIIFKVKLAKFKDVK